MIAYIILVCLTCLLDLTQPKTEIGLYVIMCLPITVSAVLLILALLNINSFLVNNGYRHRVNLLWMFFHVTVFIIAFIAKLASGLIHFFDKDDFPLSFLIANISVIVANISLLWALWGLGTHNPKMRIKNEQKNLI